MSRIRIAAMLAALALIPAAANAQSTITACYVPKTGSVYRIQAPGAPDACKTNHVQFSWTDAASSGGTVFTRRAALPVDVVPNEYAMIAAACLAGETAVGGGYFAMPNVEMSVAANGPLVSSVEYWYVDLRNLGIATVTVNVYAICAGPAS